MGMYMVTIPEDTNTLHGTLSNAHLGKMYSRLLHHELQIKKRYYSDCVSVFKKYRF